ncbi:hypothetical protein FB451DRAFT_1486980 [Mycena latifolia]|nr:hypothetical protein FB451DRAFT_1486980 [Mycena latifolia]
MGGYLRTVHRRKTYGCPTVTDLGSSVPRVPACLGIKQSARAVVPFSLPSAQIIFPFNRVASIQEPNDRRLPVPRAVRPIPSPRSSSSRSSSSSGCALVAGVDTDATASQLRDVVVPPIRAPSERPPSPLSTAAVLLIAHAAATPPRRLHPARAGKHATSLVLHLVAQATQSLVAEPRDRVHGHRAAHGRVVRTREGSSKRAAALPDRARGRRVVLDKRFAARRTRCSTSRVPAARGAMSHAPHPRAAPLPPNHNHLRPVLRNHQPDHGRALRLERMHVGQPPRYAHPPPPPPVRSRQMREPRRASPRRAPRGEGADRAGSGRAAREQAGRVQCDVQFKQVRAMSGQGARASRCRSRPRRRTRAGALRAAAQVAKGAKIGAGGGGGVAERWGEIVLACGGEELELLSAAAGGDDV